MFQYIISDLVSVVYYILSHFNYFSCCFTQEVDCLDNTSLKGVLENIPLKQYQKKNNNNENLNGNC